MHNYNITLFNNKEAKWLTESVETMTFAEAARTAYLIKNKKGFDWEIQGITKIKTLHSHT